jgi:hypothetical protein
VRPLTDFMAPDPVIISSAFLVPALDGSYGQDFRCDGFSRKGTPASSNPVEQHHRSDQVVVLRHQDGAAGTGRRPFSFQQRPRRQGLLHQREVELERGAESRLAVGPDVPATLFYDTVDHHDSGDQQLSKTGSEARANRGTVRPDGDGGDWSWSAGFATGNGPNLSQVPGRLPAPPCQACVLPFIGRPGVLDIRLPANPLRVASGRAFDGVLADEEIPALKLP